MAVKPILITIGILALLVVSAIFITEQSGLGCTGGISISGATYIPSGENNHPLFDNKGFVRITAVQNGQGECARVSINPSTINQFLNNDISEEVTIDIRNNGQTKKYTITEDTVSSRDALDYKVDDIGFEFACNIGNCVQDGFPTTFYAQNGGSIFSPKCYCFYEDKIGDRGTINPSELTILDNTISVSGFNEQDIVSTNTQQAIFGDDVLVKWQGNLMANQDFTNPNANYDTVLQQNIWHLASKGVGTNNQAFRQQIINCLPSSGLSEDEAQDCVDVTSNSAVGEASSKNNELEGLSIVDTINFIGANLFVNLDEQVRYPQFTIDVDGEFLGITFTEGEPKVTCPSRQEILSGDLRNVILRAENEGDGIGNFNLFLNCEGSPMQVNPSNMQGLQPNEQRTANGVITGEAIDGSESYTCEFKAVDTSGNQDSCTFGLDVDERPEGCGVAGETLCSLANTNTLLTCGTDGDYFQSECENICAIVDGTAQCVDEINENNTQALGECNIVKLGDITLIPDFTGESNQPREVLGMKGIPVSILGIPLGTITFGEEVKPCFGGLDAFAFLIGLLGAFVVFFMFFSTFKDDSKTVSYVLGTLTAIITYILMVNYILYGIGLLIALVLINGVLKKFKLK